MLARGQHFSDAKISVDGGTFDACTFERCTLVYSALLPTHISKCQFKDTRWEFAGAALNTLHFLAGLYASGGKSLVETTFDRIRRGPDKRPQSMRMN
jgi:hypothetical protein